MNDPLERTTAQFKLNNGVEMPAFGLGVYQIAPEETANAVETAIGAGYRLIDTAAAYFNEAQVGEGLRRSGIDRSELFVATKLWMSDYGYDSALRAFDHSRRNLGLNYIDLYLLHWPVPSDFDRTIDSYRALETLLSDGRVRAIGVCNFSAEHLEKLSDRTGIVPAVNQVELQPFFAQPKLREANAQRGVVTQAWSPIGGINRYYGGGKDPLQHPTIVELARRHGKTPAQVVLRWHIQNGVSTIPKSVRAERIAENFDIFDFELSEAELAAIEVLDTDRRSGPDPDEVSPKLFDIRIEA